MAGRLEGKVASVTPAGDLVTDIPVERLRVAPRSTDVSALCGEHETRGLFPPTHQEASCTFLAIVPEAGCLYFTLVGESAAQFLGLAVGDDVTISW